MAKMVKRATEFESRNARINSRGRRGALELAFDLNERETMQYPGRVSHDNFRIVEPLRMSQGGVADQKSIAFFQLDRRGRWICLNVEFSRHGCDGRPEQRAKQVETAQPRIGSQSL